MSRRAWILAIALCVLVDAPGTCYAGTILSEMVRARVQSISFFAACFLLCTWLVRRIWNALTVEFPRLPWLSNGKAVGLGALFGLLALVSFVIVSGSHELMTSRAWREESSTDRLADNTERAAQDRNERARHDRLENLSVLLHHYAKMHGGKYPPDDQVVEIPPELWKLPDPSGMRYLYASGRSNEGGVYPLVYEPGIFGKDRLVLMTDGSIREMGIRELEAMLARGDR